MTERVTREQKDASPQRGGVDQARRNLTRLGVGGAPVLMTLASRPVLGANCLSNALSGNLSDPNRGMCQLGYSIDTIAAMGAWGVVNPDTMVLGDTPIAALGVYALNDQNRALRELLINGSYSQQVFIAAWVNSMIKVDYMMSEQQYMDLVSGSLPVPGNQSVLNYLASTLVP